MAEEAAEEKKKSGMLKWIILVILLLGLGGGGYFAYMKFLAAPPADAPAEQAPEGEAPPAEAPPAEEHAAPPAEEGGGGHGGEGGAAAQENMASIPTFVVNLADAGGRRYLKLTLDVEVKNAAAVAEVQKNMSKIRDAILLLLSSKQRDDLTSMEGKITLRREIAERINQSLGGEPKVVRVYFTEFVIQ